MSEIQVMITPPAEAGGTASFVLKNFVLIRTLDKVTD
jgi:hypothetical protein